MEIIVNARLADLLSHHGVYTSIDNELVNTDLLAGLKFKARVVCKEVSGGISSRLDVMVITNTGERIVECFGDFGVTVDDAINKNFQNFSLSALHPILVAFSGKNITSLKQVEFEEWEVNDSRWEVYIGNLVPKSMNGEVRTPPVQFFQSIERAIRGQKLTNKLHWFRSYYCQINANITEREFLMDNEVKNADSIFSSIPVISNVTFYSCRNFVLMKRIN